MDDCKPEDRADISQKLSAIDQLSARVHQNTQDLLEGSKQRDERLDQILKDIQAFQEERLPWREKCNLLQGQTEELKRLAREDVEQYHNTSELEGRVEELLTKYKNVKRLYFDNKQLTEELEGQVSRLGEDLKRSEEQNERLKAEMTRQAAQLELQDRQLQRLKSTSDLIQDFRMETTFLENGLIKHTRASVGKSAGRRQAILEDTWRRRGMLGYGTFGTVWLEESVSNSPDDPKRKTLLRAVKDIPKHRSLRPVDFQREIEAVAKFSQERFAHCFVRSLGWFENDRSLFIAMEYLRYGELQRYLGRPFPEAEARQVTLQIIEGLHFMHSNEFAHRDLKPGNVLVLRKGPGWWVKIGDFGICKRGMGDATALRTLEIGTRGYMAPELSGLSNDEDASTYTNAVDMWALGQIAHRMLTGKGCFEDMKFIGAYVYKDEPFPTTALEMAGTSADGIGFVKQAMAASPAKRLSADQGLEHPWLVGHSWIDGGEVDEDESDEPHFVEDMPPEYKATLAWTTLSRPK